MYAKDGEYVKKGDLLLEIDDVVDREHSAIDYGATEDIIRTAKGVGLATVVRIPSSLEEHVFHALDSGADGVQIPNITSVSQAEESVRCAKYSPEGCRGLSRTTRAARYGAWDNEIPYVKYANDNSLVVVHIENKEMAEQVEAICQIPQIDVVFVGPADMSQSLGIPGQSNDPRVVEIASRVIATARRYGKAGGINVTNEAGLKQYIDMGATYITYNADTGMLMSGAKNIVKQFSSYKK